jgi:hypothetical protein
MQFESENQHQGNPLDSNSWGNALNALVLLTLAFLVVAGRVVLRQQSAGGHV